MENFVASMVWSCWWIPWEEQRHFSQAGDIKTCSSIIYDINVSFLLLLFSVSDRSRCFSRKKKSFPIFYQIIKSMGNYSYLISGLNWFLSCTTASISFLPFWVSSETGSRCKRTSQIPRFSFFLRNVVLPDHKSTVFRQPGISLLMMLLLLACSTWNILEMLSNLAYFWTLTGGRCYGSKYLFQAMSSAAHCSGHQGSDTIHGAMYGEQPEKQELISRICHSYERLFLSQFL